MDNNSSKNVHMSESIQNESLPQDDISKRINIS
jgi:hypothetical protein